MYFFAQSVPIKLVLPQAAQLSIHFLLRKNQQCCTSSRDLIKDTPLRDRKKRIKPSTQRESNPRPKEICSACGCSTTVLQPMLKEYFFNHITTYFVVICFDLKKHLCFSSKFWSEFVLFSSEVQKWPLVRFNFTRIQSLSLVLETVAPKCQSGENQISSFRLVLVLNNE